MSDRPPSTLNSQPSTLNPKRSTAPWTDSHCHLAMSDFDGDRADAEARAEEAGVVRMVVVGTTPEDWAPAAALARLPSRRCTAGLHPHEAARWDEECRSGLRLALSEPAIGAVGELGLDYHYDLSPRDVQRKVFEAQLGLAAELALPVVIHSREAFADTVDILAAFLPGLRGVIHCFTYGPAEAEAFLELGFHLSFSGILTFPKAPLIREAALLTPLDRLLVETDAPYLAPVPHRGKRCEPAHAAITGRFVASLKGLEEGEAARRTSANAARLFGWE